MRSKQVFYSGEEDSQTQRSILRAAERLFATEGIEQTTMRAITGEAGTNLAAVNYHFGSKMELAYAVFDRLAGEVSASRLAELDILERAAGPNAVPLDSLIRAFIRPYVEGDEDRRRLVIRLILQHRLAPSPLTTRISATHFDPLAARFIRALQRSVPQLPPRDVHWRYHLMVGAILAAASDVDPANRLARLSNGVADPARRLELTEEAIAFILSGWQGPPTAEASPTGRRRKPRV